MGVEKATRDKVAEIESKMKEAEEAGSPLDDLKKELKEALTCFDVDFEWEIDEYELGILLRCGCEMNKARLPAVNCLRKVSIHLSLSQPMMDLETEKRLNPLAVTLIRAENMPDKPLNHRQLMERCNDPYACYTFLGQRMETFGLKHASTLNWKHTSVFFAGLEDQAELIKVLDNEPLEIYIHDRDPKELSLVDDEELESLGIKEWYYKRKREAKPDPDAPDLPAPLGASGVVTCKLSPLSDETDSRSELIIKSNVVPCTPQQTPYDTDKYEKQSQPGHYTDCETKVFIKVTLAHPLKRVEPIAGDYQRCIYRMKYNERQSLQYILATVAEINADACTTALLKEAKKRALGRIPNLPEDGTSAADGLSGSEDETLLSAKADMLEMVKMLKSTFNTHGEEVAAASEEVPAAEEDAPAEEEAAAAVEESVDVCSAESILEKMKMWRAKYVEILTDKGGPDEESMKTPIMDPDGDAWKAVLVWCDQVDLDIGIWRREEEDAVESRPDLVGLMGLEEAPVLERDETPDLPLARYSPHDEEDEEEWVDPNSIAAQIAQDMPDAADDAAAKESAAKRKKDGEGEVTARTKLKSEAACGNTADMLHDNARMAEEAVGPPPKGEIGLRPLADELSKHRAAALGQSVSRSAIFEAASNCRDVAVKLREAADVAAKLEESKVKAANTEEAEVHEAQKDAARAAADEIDQLAEQMDTAAAVEAAGVADALREGGLETEGNELDRLRNIVLQAPSRQMLENAAPECRALATELNGKGKSEEAEKVLALEAQMLKDGPEAQVYLAPEEDYISGFHLMDGQDRILVLEGLHKGAMKERLLPICPKAKAGQTFPYTVLFNGKVSFKKRIYESMVYDVRLNGGVMKVRLDGGEEHGGAAPLSHLMLSKTMYYRGDPRAQNRVEFGVAPPERINELAYQGLNICVQLLIQPRMWDVSTLGLFPSREHLDSLEVHMSTELDDDDRLGPELDMFEETMGLTGTQNVLTIPREPHVRRKAATDQANPDFIKAKAGYKAPDNIKVNIANVTPLEPPLRMEKWWETETRPVYVYSGQKLQYTEWQKEQIRERAIKDTKNHYTYSQQYISGSLCPVNAEQLEEDQERERRSKFITEKGFVYPAPKEPTEFNKHPYAISEARAIDLRSAWEPPPGGDVDAISNNKVDKSQVPEHLRDRPDYSTTPCFSGYFEQDPFNSWRSVHLPNDSRPQQFEMKQKQMKQWREKMVVDDATVKVHWKGVMRTRVSQLDRSEGTLKDLPKKKSLAEMPFPIARIGTVTEKYPDRPVGGLLARQNHPDKWVSPDDYRLFVNSKYKPYKQTKVYGEKTGGLLQIKEGGLTSIKPLRREEKTGPFYGTKQR